MVRIMQIREISSKKDLKKFINFAWEIYKDDDNWVPPLKFDLLNTISGKDNALFLNGEHKFFMAYEGDKPLGRICAGINSELNEKKNLKDGYITLFECVNDEKTAFKLFDSAIDYLKSMGVNTVKGPVSPTNGDDNRGLLVKGFDGSPVLLNSYNPEYYVKFFDDYGFVKHLDLYAYFYDLKNFTKYKRYEKIVDYAEKKYNFHVENMGFKTLDRDLKDIKRILDIAMPTDWEDLTPPTMEEIKAEVKNLKAFIDEDQLYIARSDGEPVGFAVAFPDYYQVIKRMNGNIIPLGMFKYFKYRKKITGSRMLILFVVPEFRKKAVSSVMFYRYYQAVTKKHYSYIEGSTVGETNEAVRRDLEKSGGVHYRTYRLYKKLI